MANEKITLQKDSAKYNLIIPSAVEDKIRYMCEKISNIEWSGILFYDYKGSFENNDLEIICKDIFVMDIGNSTYTEFNMSPDVISYMTEHPELLDYQTALIHSHHSMTSFFSGTDLSTLQEEGNCRNHFVSLIVNNAGVYTAAITRKIVQKKNIHSDISYNTFNDKTKKEVKDEEVDNIIILYNELNIIKEKEESSFPELDERLDYITKEKEEQRKKEQKTVFNISTLPHNFKKTKNSTPSLPLFNDDYYDDYYDFYDTSIIDKITIPAVKVNAYTAQILTGCITTEANSINLTTLANQMVNTYEKRFNGDLNIFGLWVETLVEFIISNFIPKDIEPYEGEYQSKLCTLIYNTIDKLPSNKYINEIKNVLTIWMKD